MDTGVCRRAITTGSETREVQASGPVARSSDPNDDTLHYGWVAPEALSIDAPNAPITGARFPIGSAIATLTVSEVLLSSSDEVAITVIDGAPPALTAITPNGPGIYAGADAILIPQAEAIVVGSVDIAANAVDECTGIASITFLIDDGTTVVDTEAPYGFTYTPEGVGIQYRTMTVFATDGSGKESIPYDMELTVVATTPRVPA